MKLSDIKHALVKIFTDRNVQLTVVFFTVGLLLVIASTYPALEERVEEDTLTSENTEDDLTIEARLPRPYNETPAPFLPSRERDRPILPGSGPRLGLKNATLEVNSYLEETNATITISKYEDSPARMRSVKIEGIENRTINMTEYHEAEYIEFNITKGELSYTYRVRSYIQPYSFLSIPGGILMIPSLIFLVRAIALMGPLKVDREEQDKIKEDQKVLDSMLKDRSDDDRRKGKND